MAATHQPVRRRVVWVIEDHQNHRSDPGAMQHIGRRVELAAQRRRLCGAGDFGGAGLDISLWLGPGSGKMVGKFTAGGGEKMNGIPIYRQDAVEKLASNPYGKDTAAFES